VDDEDGQGHTYGCLMRTKEQRTAAERAVRKELKELESRTSCRVIASVGWNPLRGFYGEVKVFKVASGKIDTSPAADDVSTSFLNELMPILSKYDCVMLPNLKIVGETASAVSVAIVGSELVDQRPAEPTTAAAPPIADEESDES